MAVEVVMPQMGESVVEGTITNWLVKEGEQVSEDQPLVAISTDKVDTEIPSPAAGVIARIVAKEGETLPIGALLAVIETGAATAPEPSTPSQRRQRRHRSRRRPPGRSRRRSAATAAPRRQRSHHRGRRAAPRHVIRRWCCGWRASTEST
jgi:pyruvate dehydrogenase E2 component (dihydrolipoamide acetyltransferase)